MLSFLFVSAFYESCSIQNKVMIHIMALEQLKVFQFKFT